MMEQMLGTLRAREILLHEVIQWLAAILISIVDSIRRGNLLTLVELLWVLSTQDSILAILGLLH
jgi:hypothetical protein